MQQLKNGLVIPAGIDARGVQRENLGTDAVGPGEWRKTNNTLAVTQALHDAKARTGMSGPELFGALVENVIAAIQGSAAPSQWREIADATCGSILRRMDAR